MKRILGYIKGHKLSLIIAVAVIVYEVATAFHAEVGVTAGKLVFESAIELTVTHILERFA